MAIAGKTPIKRKHGNGRKKTIVKDLSIAGISTLPGGVVYSKRYNCRHFTAPQLKDYKSILGEARTERVMQAAERLKGIKVLELNATAQGGGVAEMLYSSVPFLNNLGVETEWKVIKGNDEFFECTKGLHNLLQG